MGVRHSRQADVCDDPLDFGPLAPPTQTASNDYDAKLVRRFIKEGRLAPFYQGHYEKPYNDNSNQMDLLTSTRSPKHNSMLAMTAHRMNLLLSTHIPEDAQTLALYKETLECPICFLFYPPFINHTRCCDKLICTECFLQLKRSIDLPLLAIHCPFCMQSHLGVIRVPPPWSLHYANFCKRRSEFLRDQQLGKWKRLDIFDPDVVLVDHVRPEWQERLGSALGNTSSSGSTRRAVVRPLQISPPPPTTTTHITPGIVSDTPSSDIADDDTSDETPVAEIRPSGTASPSQE